MNNVRHALDLHMTVISCSRLDEEEAASAFDKERHIVINMANQYRILDTM